MCFSLRSAKLKLVSSQLMRKRRTADATVHYFECTITPKSRMLDSCLAVACTSKHYLLWVTFLCMSFWVTFLYTSFLLHIRTIALHRLGIFSSASYHSTKNPGPSPLPGPPAPTPNILASPRKEVVEVSTFGSTWCQRSALLMPPNAADNYSMWYFGPSSHTSLVSKASGNGLHRRILAAKMCGILISVGPKINICHTDHSRRKIKFVRDSVNWYASIILQTKKC